MPFQMPPKPTQAQFRRAFLNQLSPNQTPVFLSFTSGEELAMPIGSIDQIVAPSTQQRGQFDVVGTIRGVPDVQTHTFSQMVDFSARDVWYALARQGCGLYYLIVDGQCIAPDNLAQYERLTVVKAFGLTSYTPIDAYNPLGEATTDPALISGEISYGGANNFKQYGKLFAGEKASSTIVGAIVDLMYNDRSTCEGDCGAGSDGVSILYALAQATTGSLGNIPQLVVTLNANTFNSYAIGSTSGQQVSAFDILGDALVILAGTTTPAHYITSASAINGGATPSFTQVTTGWVASKQGLDIWVKNPSLAFIAGAGGYIYKMTSTAAVTVLDAGTKTTQDLRKVSGAGKTTVFVGNANAVVITQNDGQTFSTITGPAVGEDLTALYCSSENLWFVGTSTGKLFVREGNTWTQKLIDGATPTRINDIKSDGIMLYVSYDSAAGPNVAWSPTNGSVIFASGSRINNVPTANTYGPIAVPTDNPTAIAFGGDKATGGDGILVIASE
jgi:hypothetical protein